MWPTATASPGDRDVYAKTAADQADISGAIDAFGSAWSLVRWGAIDGQWLWGQRVICLKSIEPLQHVFDCESLEVKPGQT